MSLGRRQYVNNPTVDSKSVIIAVPTTGGGTVRSLIPEINTALTAASITRRNYTGIYISAARGSDVFLNQVAAGSALTGFGLKITAGTNLFLPILPDANISYESAAIVDVMVVFG